MAIARSSESHEDLPKRWPLVVQPNNRSDSTIKDARLVNCYMEKQPDGSYAIIKRPALASTYIAVPAAVGKGMWTWPHDGFIYSVFGDTFYQNSNNFGTVDNTAGKQYFFEGILGATATLILGNGVAGYGYNSGAGLFPMAGVQPPANFQRNFCYLDGTVYYINANAQIYGSGINTVTTWDPSNVIVANSDSDIGKCLTKQISYVIALKQWTTEFFYDAGNASGSPLARNSGARLNYGCCDGDTVCEVDGELFWIGQTRNGTPQVYCLNNANFRIVSTPWVDRLIKFANFGTPNNCYAWCYKGEGHSFYIITLKDINLTLAYDVREQAWSQWTDSDGNYMPIVDAFSAGFSVFAQHESNGKIYYMSGTANADYEEEEIPVDIYTPNFDGGVGHKKMLNMIQVNADQTPGNVLQMRFNDYDYDPARWTNFRNVDLGQQRPTLFSLGSFYRRAIHIHHNSPHLLRLYSLDLGLDLGTL